MPPRRCSQQNPDFRENIQRKLPDLCQHRCARGQKADGEKTEKQRELRDMSANFNV